MALKGKIFPAIEREMIIDKTVFSLATKGNSSDITTPAITERMDLTQGAPCLLFSEFQRTEENLVRNLVHSLLKKLDCRLVSLLEEGKKMADMDFALDFSFAAALFMGTIQDLVLQSQFKEDNRDGLLKALEVFGIYRRGIERRDPA